MNTHPVSRWRKTVTLLVVMGCALIFFAGAGWAQLTEADLSKIPAGDQPIKFSHLIHAGQDAIPCQYCHVYARRSAVAGVPPMAICMGCHTQVATQLTEIIKVTDFWKRKEPISWVKIHDVPDFVKFPHNRHVNAKNETFPAGVPCETCHGDVKTMSVVEVVTPDFGTMGWCLDCHLTVPGAFERKRAVAETVGGLSLKNLKHPKGHTRPNTTDCLTCHY